jgi:two-component system phosphate regulon sensor histidine kinase PhoR
MHLRKHLVGIIIAVSSVALAGLMALQLYLLSNAMELEKQAFERNVHAAMKAVAQRLERSEAARTVFDLAVPGQERARMAVVEVAQDSGGARVGRLDSLRVIGRIEIPKPPIISSDTVIYRISQTQQAAIHAQEETDRVDTVLARGRRASGEYQVMWHKKPEGGIVYEVRGDSLTAGGRPMGWDIQPPVQPDRDSVLTTVRIAPGVWRLAMKRVLVEDVIERMVVREREPLEVRIRPALLDSLITLSLAEAGIRLSFAFGVMTAGPDSLRFAPPWSFGVAPAGPDSLRFALGLNLTAKLPDSLRIAHPPQYADRLASSALATPLFPNDVFFNDTRLVLYFPDQTAYLLRRIGPLLGVTLLLMGLLVWCFVVTLRTIVAQKRFYQRLVDFINNMTHEFKTPISTISVAAETILRPDVVAQPERVGRYGTIIQEENRRMGRQVEAILQMAALEEGDYDLAPAPVDVHPVLSGLIAAFSVQAEARGGAVTGRLEADRPVIQADPVHLHGIFQNVLDNAMKYSPDAPQITVTTDDAGDRLRVRITDRGAGIPAEEILHVFDKYYRVPTGNRHDVKGFGLGLSYVKRMVEAHRGAVSIDSAPGRGTTVTMTFPTA